MENFTLNCTAIAKGILVCNGMVYVEEEPPLSYTEGRFWLFCGGYIGLVLMAGLMSGLTMGLLSLDLTSLKVLQEGGKPHEQRYAAKIVPLVQRHHLLLVTLLLGNAAAVEAMPLCLDHISDPVTAILVSVTAVLIFGEVVPQALCTRYGLAIGAALSPLVYILMALTFVVSYPISKLLDILLGEEHGTFYRRAELKVLVGMHGPQSTDHSKQNTANEDPLTNDEVIVIKGALELREKKVVDAMLPLQKVFMLSTDTVLDEDTMSNILKAGHSRIPIFEDSHENIVGVLMVKTLLCLKAQDALPLRQMTSSKSIRAVHKVYDIMPLYELLDIFQTGRSHLSIVYSSETTVGSTASGPQPESRILGIITLEDVIEELIQEEIYDEKDVPENNRLAVSQTQAWRIPRIMLRSPWRLNKSEGDWLQSPLEPVSRVGRIQEDSNDEADETTALLTPHHNLSSNSLP